MSARFRLVFAMLTASIALAGLNGCATTSASQNDLAPEAVYAQAKAAAVEILVDSAHSGSAFMVGPDGLAMTALHVVGRGGAVLEALVGGHRVPVRVLAVDRGHDLALIDVGRAPKGDWPFLRFADAPAPPASAIRLMGAPQFRHDVMLQGHVARDGTTFEWLGDQGAYLEVFHIAGHTPWGVSGGPWLNSEGLIVGLQSSMMVNRGAMVGIGYSSPLSAMRRLFQERSSARTAGLGAPFEEVWEHGPSFLRRLPPKTMGCVVRTPIAGSPLHAAGVKAWDVIVAVDRKPIRFRDELMRAVREKGPGDKVVLTVLKPDRGGRRDVTVTLQHLEIGWLPKAR